MAWTVNGTTLKMIEGDFGIKLPVTIGGTTLSTQDAVKLTFKSTRNGTEILSKDYSNIQNNTFDLELTEAQSALFPVGTYAYSLDWYQSGNFMCNIIDCAVFKVGDKA